ncbi:MAG: hypothetical protein OSJ34_07345 [Muribaculaceae bacterium]|nr:hypothetical protein [Muribaculaceae bacterium]
MAEEKGMASRSVRTHGRQQIQMGLQFALVAMAATPLVRHSRPYRLRSAV